MKQRRVKEISLKGKQKEMAAPAAIRGRIRLPLIRGKAARKLDLNNAEIADILGV